MVAMQLLTSAVAVRGAIAVEALAERPGMWHNCYSMAAVLSVSGRAGWRPGFGDGPFPEIKDA
jgi:hypothetical protein